MMEENFFPLVSQQPLFAEEEPQEASRLDALVADVRRIYREIQELYVQQKMAWAVGLSGGKDSTATTQLVWRAIAQLPVEERCYPIFVVSGDTLVEDPAMVARLQRSIHRINAAACTQHMPVTATLVRPLLQDRYFVKLLGKGYPAPTTHFRWCTDRLKIEPATRFLKKQGDAFGEVIVALGAREDESTTRGQTMQAYEMPGSLLRRHSSLASAYVYAPIAKWDLAAVWDYLLNNPSPWGDNNRELAALYKRDEGECPLVIDSSTPTCGGGRYGCWTCTVSAHNRSLENRYEDGEEWLRPLLEFRELLKQTIAPGHKLEYRDIRGRRDHRVYLTRKGEISPRSYTLSTRKMLLKRLLQAQRQVQEEGPDPGLELIAQDELEEIRRIWMVEDADWEDSVRLIYREVLGKEGEWNVLDFGIPWLSEQGAEWKRLMLESCAKHDVPFDLIAQLLDHERVHRRQRSDVPDSPLMRGIDRILRKDWRDPQLVARELLAQRAEAEIQQQSEMAPREQDRPMPQILWCGDGE